MPGSFVYVITHLPTARHYVGKSDEPCERWKQHLRGKRNRDSYIQRALAKYGAGQFLFQELEWFETDGQAFEAERWWIAFLQSNKARFGFNLSDGGEGNSGYEMPPGARAKISESSKRRWAKPGERERQAELTRKLHTGLKRSSETCRRVAAALKGKHLASDQKARHAEAMRATRGVPKPGTSAALKARPKSAEHRAKIGQAHVGMKRSEEARRRMSEASKRRTDRGPGKRGQPE